MNKDKKEQIENNLHTKEKNILDLANENLSITDYEWLYETVTQSSSIEIIRLPIIEKESARNILSILDRLTRKNSLIHKITLRFSVKEDKLPKEILFIKKQIQSRLQRNKKRIFGIQGGGNIGLGLMAEIVAKSPYPYRLLATSSNVFMRNLINCRNALWLQYNEPNKTTSKISDLSMISRKTEDIIRLYSESSLIAICVTSEVIADMAHDIAKGLLARYQIDGSGLKILILMNQPECEQLVSKVVYQELLMLVNNPLLVQKIWSSVEFIPTVIDRIVSTIPISKVKHQLKNQLQTISEKKLQQQLAETNIENIIFSQDKLMKAIKQFKLKLNLFKAEYNFTMHAPDSFVEGHRFPGMHLTNDLKILAAVKNKYINGPHAVLAWLGALLGYQTIAEAINQPQLFLFIKDMMEKEIGPILLKEYPAISTDELQTLEKTFFKRCVASTDDLVTRVGRDPLRKLASGGRIRGTLELAGKHAIETPRLEKGLAAGFLYGILNCDPLNPGCQKINEIYKANGNSFPAVLRYHGRAPGGIFIGIKDDILLNKVLSKMTALSRMHTGLVNKHV